MSTASLPKAVELELDVAPTFSPALVGLVEAAGVLLRRLDYDVSDDELLAISSVAFCNYVFEPKHNQHEDPVRSFSRLGSYFSNYGPWESISYYTGAEMRELTHVKGVDLAKLVAFELSQERPIVTLDDELQARLVTRYSISVERRIAGFDDGTEVDLASDSLDWQGNDEVFRNWMLLVRPGTPQDWAAPSIRQRVDVLRWASDHGASSKEFFQETRENYAPGLNGIESFAGFLGSVSDAPGAAYAEDYLRALRRARHAASVVVSEWAEEIAEYLHAPSVADDLRAAAASWGRVSAAIAEAHTLRDSIDEVVASEHEAFAALNRAATHFPSPFEGL